jgi:IPT/TIG domain
MRIGSMFNNRILTFPLPSSGNAKPISSLTSNPAKRFSVLAYDAQGDLWGITTDGSAVVEYTAAQLSSGGSETPHTSITVTGARFLAFDGSGDLWVTAFNNTIPGSAGVVEFTPNQLAEGGTQTPETSISADRTTPPSFGMPTGIAFDVSGDLWVANIEPGSLVEFTPTQLETSGAPTPKVVLYGKRTDLTTPRGIAFDAIGNLWVGDFPEGVLSKFTPTELALSGSPRPATTIKDAAVWQLSFDTRGILWVTNPITANSVSGWTPSQQAVGGSISPDGLVKGATTTLSGPYGLAISAAPTITAVTPSAGVAGTTVTVHGTGFDSGTKVAFGSRQATTVHVVSPFTLTVKAPPGGGTVTVTATTWAGTSATSTADKFTYKLTGYDLAGSDGGVFVFPVGQTSGFFGSLPGLHVTPVAPIVGLVPTITDEGYFLVGNDGGVFAFGTAPFLGSLPGKGVVPAAPISGIVAADTDKGYFLVGKDGGVFAFGTVPFLGSLPGKGISVNNVTGIASTPSGNGYWVVTATGTVYGFGSAQRLGTAKGTSSPVSAIAGTPTGGGYWITTQNGTVYPFGNAKSFSTLPAIHVNPNLPVIGIVHTGDTKGYWLIAQDGGIFAFGDAGFVGSLPSLNVHVSNIVGAVPS